MSNHERAKKIMEEMQPGWGATNNWMVEAIEKLLDATEPERRSLSKTIAEHLSRPAYRPAFVGDEVQIDDLTHKVIGVSSPGQAYVRYGEGSIHSRSKHAMSHPDGARVSRVLPYPREIESTSLLRFEELKDNRMYSRFSGGEWFTPMPGVHYKVSSYPYKRSRFLPMPVVRETL